MTDMKQEPQAAEPTGGNQEPKTFTQDEVNEIVEKRLWNERKKYENFEALKEKAEKFDELEAASMSELEKMTKRAEAAEAELNRKKEAEKVRGIRDRVAAEMKVPANLLTGATEEECRTQAQGILDFAKPAGYPQVRTAPAQAPAGNRSPRDAFAEYMTEVMGKRR